MGLREKSLVETLPPAEIRCAVWEKVLGVKTGEMPDLVKGSFSIHHNLEVHGKATDQFDRNPWLYSRYSVFSEKEYYTLMAFAENLTVDDFHDFNNYFWKNTTLELHSAILSPLEIGWIISGEPNDPEWLHILGGTVSPPFYPN